MSTHGQGGRLGVERHAHFLFESPCSTPPDATGRRASDRSPTGAARQVDERVGVGGPGVVDRFGQDPVDPDGTQVGSERVAHAPVAERPHPEPAGLGSAHRFDLPAEDLHRDSPSELHVRFQLDPQTSASVERRSRDG